MKGGNGLYSAAAVRALHEEAKTEALAFQAKLAEANNATAQALAGLLSYVKGELDRQRTETSKLVAARVHHDDRERLFRRRLIAAGVVQTLLGLLVVWLT
jgi:hypothetical protein